MDGWWNEDLQPQGIPEQQNPFGQLSEPYQPQVDASSVPMPGQLYAPGGDVFSDHARSFSQIRQGDKYGYAMPETVPAPAFPGNDQNPFGDTIGALPFGAVTPDALTGELTGGFPSFSGGMDTGAYRLDTGSFMPVQPGLAGFPPLDGSAPWQGAGNTGTMPPVDGAAPWQNTDFTGTMPPVDGTAPWQSTDFTGTMPPVDGSAPWQSTGNTGTMPPVDGTAPWQGMGNTGTMPPVDGAAPWQTPAPDAMSADTQRWQPDGAPLWQEGNPSEPFPLPEFPAEDADFQPSADAGETPDFLKQMLEEQPVISEEERLNIPPYLRRQPLPRKRTPKKPAAENAAKTPSDAAAVKAPVSTRRSPANADENGSYYTDDIYMRPAAPKLTTPLRRRDAAREHSDGEPIVEQLDMDQFLRGEVPVEARPVQPVDMDTAKTEATEAARPEPTMEAPAADEPAAAEPETTGAAVAVQPADTDTAETEVADAAQPEPAAEAPAADEPAAAEPVTTEAAESVQPADTDTAETEAAEAAQPEPAAEAPATDEPAATEPVSATPVQPADTNTAETEAADTAQPEPATEAPAQPATVEAARPPERRTRRRSETPGIAPAGGLQPMGRDNAALTRKRRSQSTSPAPETAAANSEEGEAGNSLPFVKAAAAEDTGADTPAARPQISPPASLPDRSPAAGAVIAPAAGSLPLRNAALPKAGWPSLNDPAFAEDDSYRFRHLYGQRPLYGDSFSQPLPGPAPDDPNVPYIEPATDEAIAAAAEADAAADAAFYAGEAVNPYAAALLAMESNSPAPVPAADGNADFLMDGDTDGDMDWKPLPPAETAAPAAYSSVLPVEAPAASSAFSTGFVTEGQNPYAAAMPDGATAPAPAAASAEAENDFLMDGNGFWNEEAAAGQPIPGEAYGTDTPSGPSAGDIPRHTDPFPAIALLAQPIPGEAYGADGSDAPPLQPATDPLLSIAGASPDPSPAFGTSSYDAGDMPNPTRGNLPYDVVTAYDTDSRLKAELAQAARQEQATEALFTPPQPTQKLPVLPVREPKQPKPKKPPINPVRLLLLLAAIGMGVFLLLGGGHILTSYVQNTEEWTDFYNRFTADNGVSVNQAGEMVSLRSDGSTFPPSADSVQGPLVTPLPLTAGQDGSQTVSDPSAVRTRQTRYTDNELRNIREDMAKPHQEYPELLGRLLIPGLMDEPVVQRNNTFYLNHNYRGTAEEGGAVFIDSACTLETPPENLHLRASDNAPGRTFHKLWQYKNSGAAFVTQHSQATVTTLYEQLDYLLVTVFEASLDPSQPTYFNYASHPTFATDADMLAYVANARQRSLYTLPTDVQPGDRLLTLSTVSSADSDFEKSNCLVLIFRHRPQ